MSKSFYLRWALPGALSFLLGVTPLHADDASARHGLLETTVIALRDALIRVAGEQGVDRTVAVKELDRLLAESRQDPEQAAVRLNEAYVLVKSELSGLRRTDAAVVPTRPEAKPLVGPQHGQQTFERLRSSTVALRDALARIAGDAKSSIALAQLASVDARLSAADGHAARGEWELAQRDVQQAFELAKFGIRGLREGTTQVRSLSFASPEEEYRYELSRHDSYHMLYSMLVTGETNPASAVATGSSGPVDQARALRQQAEQSAATGAFQEAVKLMEQATGELVRAIRNAGVYLPG